jgi:poly(3-hydroxybutyrate) depolymerase
MGPRQAIFWPRMFVVMSVSIMLASCGSLSMQHSSKSTRLSAAVGTDLRSCNALLADFKFPNTVVDSVAVVAAGGLQLSSQPIAEHCLVKGSMYKRKGSDGREYAIGFEMRMPKAWNGRFYYQGNGGLDGNVQPAQGALGGGPLTGALMQGFAVISSDAGHSGPQTPFFGMEPQARLDYGYQAVAKLTPMAKNLIAAAYGKQPDRSYIGGCSNGGRHAMVAAARMGDAYDGYLVGAPGYRLPNSALAQLWGAQQWATLATPNATIKHPMNPNGSLPDLGSAFNERERQAVANAVLAKCDALDGLKDGIVHATQQCQSVFSIATDLPTCTAERTGSCLTNAQKNALSSTFSGGKMSSGQAIYSSFPVDPGVAGANWAMWKFVNSLALDPLAVGAVFSSPPGPVNPLTENIDKRMPLILATNETYQESGMSLMTPPGNDNPVNLASLRQRGAKMMLYHGVSDPIFSAEDTRQWYERLNRTQGGQAAEFARYFPVPGMNHCSMGPATDQFDMLTPLVAWVERGVAPASVLATARGQGNGGGVNAELPRDWAANRSRPLCASPKVATYKGAGSIEYAASFICQ